MVKVKANLKKTLEKLRSGELKPRKYPKVKQITKSEARYHQDVATFDTGEFRRLMNKFHRGYPKVLLNQHVAFFRVTQKNYERWLEKENIKTIELDEVTMEEAKKVLRENYYKVIEKLKEFCDLREDYYPIISLWVLGTYLHDQFETYPYLFFNAMKGSGKSRLLRLLSYLSKNGELLVDMTEAVLFRTAADSSFFIDETEDISSKEKKSLRALLNAGYKKGSSVKRMILKKSLEGQSYEPEKYDLYCPICMANIEGLESVLSDRCIKLILEKSSNDIINRLQENFSDDDEIKEVVSRVSRVCSVFFQVHKKMLNSWNKYVKYRYINNNSTNTTTTQKVYTNNSTDNSTNNSTNNSTPFVELFHKIGNSRLIGRVLELFFPLFIMANYCGDDILIEVIKISQTIVSEKKEEDVTENRDVALLEFISARDPGIWEKITDLTNQFKNFYESDDEESKLINNKWFGRALKRLVLKVDSRKVFGKSEVILDTLKARKQFRLFRVKNYEKEVEKK